MPDAPTRLSERTFYHLPVACEVFIPTASGLLSSRHLLSRLFISSRVFACEGPETDVLQFVQAAPVVEDHYARSPSVPFGVAPAFGAHRRAAERTPKERDPVDRIVLTCTRVPE